MTTATSSTSPVTLWFTRVLPPAATVEFDSKTRRAMARSCSQYFETIAKAVAKSVPFNPKWVGADSVCFEGFLGNEDLFKDVPIGQVALTVAPNGRKILMGRTSAGPVMIYQWELKNALRYTPIGVSDTNNMNYAANMPEAIGANGPIGETRMRVLVNEILYCQEAGGVSRVSGS